jgi:RNA polymerase sigma-70 factor, ECF subfamily
MASPFEQAVMPHLSAAHNLARWLTGDEQDAQDVVQEAYLRALRFFHAFRGGDGRAWLLAIVRNTSHDWLRQHRPRDLALPFEEEIHSPGDPARTPEALLLRASDIGRLREALASLPAAWREAVVLREIEGLSYKEIAEVAGIPIGTVMSRLARGRARLREQLAAPPEGQE